MDTKAGELARLPDGQLVMIEEVHSDGYATVRRTGGDREGTLAVCKVSKLMPQDGCHCLDSANMQGVSHILTPHPNSDI